MTAIDSRSGKHTALLDSIPEVTIRGDPVGIALGSCLNLVLKILAIRRSSLRHTSRWMLMSIAVLGCVAEQGLSDEVAPALKALQGAWKSGDPESQGLGSWIFEGDKVTVAMPAITYVADVKVQEGKTPTPIDFTIREGQAEAIGESVQGIVGFFEDRVLICVAAPGVERPASFEPRDGVFVFTLTRKKAE